MVVFNICCICWAASLGGIICYINFGDLLKVLLFIGRLHFMESLGGFNWGYYCPQMLRDGGHFIEYIL